MSANQPNILLIMADQMTAPVLPFYGGQVVKAPHLSTLAREGALFENAYCNSPLCAPSRFSMMAGRLPSGIGAYDNAACFPADVPTLAHYLRDMGYQTCLAGKMHFVGPDQLHGFEERLTTDIYPSDFGWTPDWLHFAERPSWYHNMLSVVQAGICQTSNQLDFDEEVAFHAGRKVYDLARSQDSRPFFLCVSFTHPHDPFTITADYWHRYRDEEIDLPAVKPMPYQEMDPHSQRIAHVCGLGQYAQSEERVRRARHAYYGMISYIDDKVGALLHALEQSGLRQETVVVFLSDHGEMLGERGLWYKMSFFEGSARVPLLFHAPGRFAPARLSPPVSLVDLLPTLAALGAGGKLPALAAPVDGHNLLPLLQGQELDPGPVYGELLGECAIAPVLMVRQGSYKFVASQPDPDQLYDLAADRQERANLAGDPACQEVLHAFRQKAMSRWDAAALNQEVLASQRRRQLVNRALRQGQHTPWDFQPFQDASRRYMRNHLDLNLLERTARFPPVAVPAPDGPEAAR